jgi:hypothetical protein
MKRVAGELLLVTLSAALAIAAGCLLFHPDWQ